MNENLFFGIVACLEQDTSVDLVNVPLKNYKMVGKAAIDHLRTSLRVLRSFIRNPAYFCYVSLMKKIHYKAFSRKEF